MTPNLRAHVAMSLLITLCSGLATGVGLTSAPAQVPGIDLSDEETKTQPAPSEAPQIGTPSSSDFTHAFASTFDQQYDGYLAFKKEIDENYNLYFSTDFSIFSQFGSHGQPVWLGVSYPSVTWRPFTGTAFGSGEINLTVGQQAYFSKTNTGAQAERLGLVAFPNDWASDNFSWSTLSYTQTLPGDVSWLSITGGQYNLFGFDPSLYAANAQTTFISYSFAQDATQTFPNAGLGAYLTANTTDGQVHFSGGFQGATDLAGGTLTTKGYSQGQLLYWGNAQWTPKIPGLGSGIYSLLVYAQPLVPMVSDRSIGISLSASQQLTDRWGAFFRVSNATGSDIAIRTSIATGVIRNDPFGRNPSDQAGLALGWNKTNHDAVGVLPDGVLEGEWVSEIYYNYTVFKGLSLTPDLQVFWNPALIPSSGPEAVFTLRATLFF
jgi:porin